MKRWLIILVTLILILIILVPISSAHVPVESGENDSLKSALHIDDPLKSWAIYDELDCLCAVRYYKFDLKSGDRLRVSIFTPEEKVFAPSLAVMIPGSKFNQSLPYFVEVPNGYGTVLIPGSRPDKPGYEPFTPSSYYNIVDFDEIVNTTGTYYLAVFGIEANGKFGIAVGYSESFTLEEWVFIPFDVVDIHLWEGQNIWVIFAPLIIVLAFGKILLFWRMFKLKRSPKTINGYIGSFSALIYIGTSAMLLYQMVYSLSKGPDGAGGAVGTFLFMLIPILLGVLVLKHYLKDEELKFYDRMKIMIYGVIGIFTWAGFLVGPMLLIISSLLPIRKDDNSKNVVEK
jgi:hypothetical protein